MLKVSKEKEMSSAGICTDMSLPKSQIQGPDFFSFWTKSTKEIKFIGKKKSVIMVWFITVATTNVLGGKNLQSKFPRVDFALWLGELIM